MTLIKIKLRTFIKILHSVIAYTTIEIIKYSMIKKLTYHKSYNLFPLKSQIEYKALKRTP